MLPRRLGAIKLSGPGRKSRCDRALLVRVSGLLGTVRRVSQAINHPEFPPGPTGAGMRAPGPGIYERTPGSGKPVKVSPCPTDAAWDS